MVPEKITVPSVFIFFKNAVNVSSLFCYYFTLGKEFGPLFEKKNNPKMSFIQECFVPSSVKILQVMQEKTFVFFKNVSVFLLHLFCY